MKPTIEDGSVLLVSRFSKPEVGDIVVVYSERLNKELCKRLIGVGGDSIEIRQGIVYRNGVSLDEQYNKDVSTCLTASVPDGGMYVLGDNRNNSTDSRVLGAFEESAYMGKALFDFHMSRERFRAVCAALAFLLGVSEVVFSKKGHKSNGADECNCNGA